MATAAVGLVVGDQEAMLTSRLSLGTVWQQPICRRSWKEPSGSWVSCVLRRPTYRGNSGRQTLTGR